MLVKPEFLLYPLLLFNDQDVDYKNSSSYTTSSMVSTENLDFYETFWINIIKESCDSNSMVE